MRSSILLFLFILFSSCCATNTQEQNKSVRERSASIDYREDFLGEEIHETLGEMTGMFPMPFTVYSYRADYHLIAFFDGHDTYESVEAFIFDGPRGESGDREFRAILTRHDNTQVDYLSPGIMASFRRDPGNRNTFETKGTFEYSKNKKDARLQFFLEDGNEISLIYLGQQRPDGQYGGMTDVGLHSPEGGLPLFYREQSSVSGKGSYVRIGTTRYPVPVDREISHPPFFTAYSAFLSLGYHSLILPSFGVTPLGYLIDGQISQGPTLSTGRGDSRGIRSLLSRAPDRSSGAVAKMIWDPPLPDLETLEVGSRYELRFGLDFPQSAIVDVYGDVEIRRPEASLVILDLRPGFPSWAVGLRNIRYSMVNIEGTWFVEAVSGSGLGQDGTR